MRFGSILVLQVARVHIRRALRSTDVVIVHYYDNNVATYVIAKADYGRVVDEAGYLRVYCRRLRYYLEARPFTVLQFKFPQFIATEGEIYIFCESLREMRTARAGNCS